MSGVERARKGRVSYSVKLRDFLRITAKRPGVTVCFFEGQDAKYYAYRIELINPILMWEGVNCDGKLNVLKLYSIISGHPVYGQEKTVFFVDRDFDPPEEIPVSPRVYVPQCYSIENLYVTENVFRRVLKFEFGLEEFSEVDDTFAVCLTRFQQAFLQFNEAVTLLNVWAIIQRRFERANPGSVKINLNSINLNSLITVDLEAIS